tara:strand:- start:1869 stop:2384 length:516 start_codon:yes stop_codon:yes gene_type:complete
MGKNLQKVQDMVDGNYKNKIQVGYSSQDEHHKVGDKWTDSDGYEWEQKEGFRVKVSSTPSVGMFPHQCKKCKKNCDAKSYDKDTWKRMGRCYHCQMHFEEDLKFMKIGKYGNKWQFWVRLQELTRHINGRKELEQWIDEQDKIKKEKIYDTSVANAMANENLDMSFNKNKL